MSETKCYYCKHSPAWTRQECIDNVVKKRCMLKWEDTLPLSTCEDYYWCFASGIPGIKPEENPWKETYLRNKANGVGAFSNDREGE